jgi:TPR repeat protein
VSDDRLITLRFPVALVLSIVCLATPAWADYEAGWDAYNRGDYGTAFRESQPLAEQGDANVQVLLGILYDKGQRGPHDSVQSLLWFEKAAAQGNATAQVWLGTLYEAGKGGPQDFVQAYKWYTLGEANGDKQAAEFRGVLAQKMTPTQIVEAQQLAREWTPKGQ